MPKTKKTNLKIKMTKKGVPRKLTRRREKGQKIPLFLIGK
jgi:hypothetical protein